MRRDREALLSLGSNVEPMHYVPRALERLHRRHEVLAVSSWYRSPAVGGRAPQPDFVNLALRVRTDLPPRALREACRRTEEACGRVREADRYAARTMDIDVVLMDDLVLDLGTWRLPDPQLATEAFVLVPCADVWPDALHPELHRTLAALCEDLGPDRRGALVPLAPMPDGRSA